MADVKVEDSILLSTKKNLGIDPTVTHFDVDLIIWINSAINILTQLGVGPVKGFEIISQDQTWNDFTGGDPRLNMVKSYITLKTKLSFDPPSGNAVLESYKEQIKEYECRLNYEVDPEYTFDEEVNTDG